MTFNFNGCLSGTAFWSVSNIQFKSGIYSVSGMPIKYDANNFTFENGAITNWYVWDYSPGPFPTFSLGTQPGSIDGVSLYPRGGGGGTLVV